MDSVRSSAASATQTVAATLDPSQSQGRENTTSADKSYKEQLDEAAYKSLAEKAESEKKETLYEKVVSYIPGMGSSNKYEPDSSSTEQMKDENVDSQTAPRRPEHDLQMEEFLKEQYKSKGGGVDMPNVGEGK